MKHFHMSREEILCPTENCIFGWRAQGAGDLWQRRSRSSGELSKRTREKKARKMVKSCAVQVLVVFIVVAASGSGAGGECPGRCSCIQQTVRCTRLEFQAIPEVPADTNIVDLRYNRIREIPSRAFYGKTHLHTIFLNENQVSSIEAAAFEGLPSLKYLYLNNNRISRVAPNAFASLNKLQSLFLYNNRLATVPEGLLNGMKSLRRLRLDGNALECDCRLLWLLKLLTNPTTNFQIAATCSSPSNLAGKNIYVVKESDLHCTMPKIAPSPKSLRAQLGQSVTIPCQASGAPNPDIVWMKNFNEVDKANPRIHVMSDGAIEIANMTQEDFGSYECIARNIMGETHSEAVKLDPMEERVKLQFIEQPQNLFVDSPAAIVMHCRATGDPEPNVIWSLNGSPLQLSQRHHVLSNGSLAIEPSSSADSGTYKCDVSNKYETISASAEIMVDVIPRFVVTPENHTARVGEEVVLNCEAEGNPSPTISWEHEDGQQIVFTGRIYLTGNQLHIRDAKESDSGLYICVAENTVGSSETVASVEIHSIANPPHLIIEPYDLETLQGATIELPCMGDGEPPPQVKWKKDGRTIIPTDRFRTAESGSLHIANVTILDSGRYECSITNEFGRATGQGLLIVRKPDEIAPGEKFVRMAFAEAFKEVDTAINQTVASLFSPEARNTHDYGEKFRVFRFPNEPSRELARAAEVYERTLVNIRRNIDSGKVMMANKTDFNYTEVLSAEHLELIASLSGCQAHRLKPNCTDMCFHGKYRTVDGTCNNLQNPTWGASLTGFRRILSPVYENELSMPVGWTKGRLYNGFPLPSARLVSSKMIATEQITPDSRITHMVMQWGQFLDHDLDHAIPSVSSESWDGVDCKKTCDFAAPCYPIEVPADDVRVSNRRCLDFVRSSAICGSGQTSVLFGQIQPREQINQLTSFLDASQVYGYSKQFAGDLRNMTADEGKLRIGLHFPGQKPLLPFASPTDGIDCRREIGESNVNCFTAGDIRVNEQVGLLAMHTIWFREHNRIADVLRLYNPHWDGETLYHEARKIVGAEMQHITYAHWLPVILGEEGVKMLGEYQGYNPQLNPSIANEFATAALRFGHSLINPILHRYDANYKEIPQGHLPLHQAFFAPWRLVYEGGVDPLMRGLFLTPAKLKKPQENLNVELTEKLFHSAHAVALDLAAINIQRSRDHAIPTYNEFRKFCNLTVATTFDDFRAEISSEQVRKRLKDIYGHPSNVDIWVGGILEDQVAGGKVGPLFRCLLVEQFCRLRDGDRFWYENPSVFKTDQLVQIKQSSLSRVLCDNGDNITEISEDVFVLSHLQDGMKMCEKIPEMDLRFWMDCSGCKPRPHQSGELVRRRRSLNESAAQESDSNWVDMNDERIEGLEMTIESFQKTLKQMRRKLKKLEATCQATSGKVQKIHGHCTDWGGIRRLNNEVWKEDACTQCECRHREVHCVRDKCPETEKCANGATATKSPTDCCPVCPAEVTPSAPPEVSSAPAA
ncbi:peroxidasin isoform X2 [Phlebotomus argentipes]|uniref:peroxidasin isoform X2 n=1 Tax=Phlebotomus argentipes TaxID=94469 RepID=UPI002892A8F3|nr:peroxidasin isoform X2 [Phlebotomus argentipes]